MIKQYFKCKLLTDIVINASLATEGNLQTLDYIPGSNFLGIVAKQLYNSVDAKDAYELFHSGNVSFGNAHFAVKDAQSYAMPFSLFKDKLEKDITTGKTWLHHVLATNNHRPTDEKDNFRQLKQHRSGYLNADKVYIKKIERKFSLKSAQDRATRKSADEKMFGFESIRKGQCFIFSVQFANEDYIAQVVKALVGTRSVGKSKSAQYGQVDIQQIAPPKTFANQAVQGTQLIVYAESNLCFINEYGHSTFQPSAKDFGVAGTIDWSASQIRTYSYSPWNFHRNTTNTQRDCIQKGSVIVINLTEKTDITTLSANIGAYQSEGLGRVIFNPEFLQTDSPKGIWDWGTKLTIYEKEVATLEKLTINSPLGQFLVKRQQKLNAELEIGLAVQEFIEKYSIFGDVSSSQWGGIRAIAIQAYKVEKLKENAEKNLKEKKVIEIEDAADSESKEEVIKLKEKAIRKLQKNLFGFSGPIKDKEQLRKMLANNRQEGKKPMGFLMTGVAADKYWDKQRGFKREILWNIIEQNETLGITVLAKIATEMAKLKQQKQN